MKKIYQYPLPAIFVVIITLLISCSKDGVFDPATPLNTAQSSVDSKVRPVKSGSLMLLVLPAEARPIVTVFNEDFFSKDFYLTRDGYLRIDYLPSGIYTVLVQPQNLPISNDLPVTIDNPGYANMEITGVKIANGVVTNLGVIKLH